MGVVPGFPADVGICNVAGKCGAASVGQPCGEYLGNDGGQAYGYTCVRYHLGGCAGLRACRHSTREGQTVGLGTFTSPFSSGEGGLAESGMAGGRNGGAGGGERHFTKQSLKPARISTRFNTTTTREDSIARRTSTTR